MPKTVRIEKKKETSKVEKSTVRTAATKKVLKGKAFRTCDLHLKMDARRHGERIEVTYTGTASGMLVSGEKQNVTINKVIQVPATNADAFDANTRRIMAYFDLTLA